MSNRLASEPKWSTWLPTASIAELRKEIKDLRGLLASGAISTPDGVFITDVMLAALALELGRRRRSKGRAS
jgi:hypothetical protein